MKHFLKTIVFSLLIIAANGTAFAQSSIHADSIWYTAKQDSNCLRCLLQERTLLENDSLHRADIETLERQKDGLNEALKESQNQKDEFKAAFERKTDEAGVLSEKLEKCRKTRNKLLGGVGIGSFVLGWFIKSKNP